MVTTKKVSAASDGQDRELFAGMSKFDRDVTLGCIGGGTIFSLLTWLLTYATFTNWNKGGCDSGYLELGGLVVGVAGIPFGFFISYFFERRAEAKERRGKTLSWVDRVIDGIKAVETLRGWLK
jgi:hypothetical protein